MVNKLTSSSCKWTRSGPEVERTRTKQRGWLEAIAKKTRYLEAVETGLRDRKGLSTNLSKQDKHGDQPVNREKEHGGDKYHHIVN